MLSADNQQGRFIDNLNMKLNPHYITGLVDGEGSFHIAIYRDSCMKQKVKVIPEFHVSQHKNSKDVLEALIKKLGCGYIKENHRTNDNDKTYVFVVRNREDLRKKIIPFFARYELLTAKKQDFKIFAKVVQLIHKKKHLHDKGIKQILRLAYQMNQKGARRRKKIVL